MWKLAGFLVLMVGIIGCVPPKVPTYPAIQANVTQPIKPVVSVTQPIVVAPVVTQYDYRAGCPNVASEGITTPTPPPMINPYLVHEVYKSADDYFQSNKTAPITYWMPRWDDLTR